MTAAVATGRPEGSVSEIATSVRFGLPWMIAPGTGVVAGEAWTGAAGGATAAITSVCALSTRSIGIVRASSTCSTPSALR